MVFCKFSCWITYWCNYFNNLKIELRRQRNKMSNELSNNGEFKQDYEWEDVNPAQDKEKETLWSP